MPTPFDDAVKVQKFSGYGSDLFNAALGGSSNQQISPLPNGPLDTFTKSQHTSFNDLVKAQKASTGYGSDLFNAALGGSSNQQISPLPNGPLDKLTNPNVPPKVNVPDNPNLKNSVFGGIQTKTNLETMWSKFLADYPNIGAALEAMGEHPIATAAGATLVGLGMYAAAKKWRDYVNSNKSEDTATVRECNIYNSKLNSYFADYLTEDSGAYKIISNKSALRSKREAVLASINEDSSYFINDTIGLLNEEGVITDALSNVWNSVKGLWPAFTKFVRGYDVALPTTPGSDDHENKRMGLDLPGKVEALSKWMKDNPNATAAGLAGAGLLGTYYLFKKFLGKKKFDNNDIAMSQKIDKMDPKKVSSISI